MPASAASNRISPARMAGVAVALALAAVTAVHPRGFYPRIYEGIAPVVEHWRTVHVLQFVLLPLSALVVVWLLAGSRSRAATICRWHMAAFAVAYTAFDAVAGLGTGALVAYTKAQPAEAQAVLVPAIRAFFDDGLVGSNGVIAVGASVMWFVGAMACARVLWREQGARAASLLMVISAAALLMGHPRPYGPVAFAALALAVLIARGGAPIAEPGRATSGVAAELGVAASAV